MLLRKLFIYDSMVGGEKVVKIYRLVPWTSFIFSRSVAVLLLSVRSTQLSSPLLCCFSSQRERVATWTISPPPVGVCVCLIRSLFNNQKSHQQAAWKCALNLFHAINCCVMLLAFLLASTWAEQIWTEEDDKNVKQAPDSFPEISLFRRFLKCNSIFIWKKEWS